MKLLSLKIFWVVLLLTLFLMQKGILAHEESQDTQPSGAKQEKPLAVPDLADLIPLATKLSGRSAVLEKKLAVGLDVSAVEKSFSGIVANLEGHSDELQKLKDSEDYRYGELIELKTSILSEGDSLEALSEPLTEAIRELVASRRQWLDERKRWNEWQQSLLKDETLDEVKLIFKEAQKTIDTPLSLILQQLKPMLVVQQRAGNIQARIDSLTVEVGDLISTMKRVVLVDSSPPMYSYRYFAQIRTGLLYEVKKGLYEVQWPGTKFFSRQGWLIAIQGLFSLALVIVIFSYRSRLKSSERMHFVAKRPFSAGLFVGLMTSMSFYEGAPVIWILAITVVAGTSFARIIGSLIEASWKRHFVYGLVTFLVTVRLLDAIGLPLPLFRLYMLLAALAGLSLCICWAVGTFRRGDSLMYTWGLILGSLFLVLVLIAELWGKSGLTDYLFRSSVRTMLSVFAGWLLMYLVGGGIEWIFRSSPIQRVTVVHDNTTAFVRRLTLLMDVLIGTLILSTILVIWRLYDTPAYAIKSLLSSGFTLGSQRISVGLLVTAGVILYGSFLTSWAVQKMFVEGVLTKRHVGIGVKSSIARLIHYALISIGFFLALIAIGFELTKLTIIVSALGIGIGFGLQNIVSNFICGIILLFERPIRVGDYIDIGENLAVIKRIGLRSTTVQTFDRADVIIPNTDLITTKVTNLTLTDRYVRVIIRVRVEYGSDVPLVMDTLKKCAKTNSMVMEMPKSQVLFRKFGETSLEFELRFYIANIDNKMQVESDLHQEIDREFHQSGIKIALPPLIRLSRKETGEEGR